MRFGNRKLAWLLLASCLTAILRVGGPITVTAKTDGPSKISPDLQQLSDRGPSNRQRVIVQYNETPFLLDSLLTQLGGTVIRPLNRLHMRIVDLPLNAVETLAARNDVRYVSPDRQFLSAGHLETTTGTAQVRQQTTTTLLGLISTTTVYDGHGIGIAILDSGIDSRHVSLKDQLGLSRVVVSRDFTGENRTDDVYGHGTHVASLAAGNSQIVGGAYTGVAPDARLINLRVLDAQGMGATSNVLAALDWVMANRAFYGIRVVNLSVGTPAIDSYRDDPLCRAVRDVTNAGITVIAAAGNNGKSSTGERTYGQIHSPGNEPSVITVGAANTFGTDVRSDDAITSYSSRGPTRSYATDSSGMKHYDNLLKPDLVAPGNKLVGAAAVGNSLLTEHPELDAHVSSSDTRRMMYLSGSSMAAPLVAGTVALMLQANPNLPPSMVKALLMYSAQPLAGANTLEQGAGEINVDGALRLALSVRADLSPSTPLGAPLLDGPAPGPETYVCGQMFNWSGGIVLAHSYVIGNDLITKYQKIYGPGFVLGDGVVETPSTQSIDSSRMTGVLFLGKDILTSDGTSLGQGTGFLSLALLLGDGMILSDGIMIGDGIMVGDGILIGDGILVGDAALNSLPGDDTTCMR